jgi:two-component system response regulator MprA
LLLVVDDDTRSARMLAQLLREDGYDVEVAYDGASAVARLTRAPKPDALVTDYRMPHVDGVAVARVARAIDGALPIFFVTGYPELLADLDSILPAARAEIARPPAIFTKPLAYPELTTALARAFAPLHLEHAR